MKQAVVNTIYTTVKTDSSKFPERTVILNTNTLPTKASGYDIMNPLHNCSMLWSSVDINNQGPTAKETHPQGMLYGIGDSLAPQFLKHEPRDYGFNYIVHTGYTALYQPVIVPSNIASFTDDNTFASHLYGNRKGNRPVLVIHNQTQAQLFHRFYRKSYLVDSICKKKDTYTNPRVRAMTKGGGGNKNYINVAELNPLFHLTDSEIDLMTDKESAQIVLHGKHPEIRKDIPIDTSHGITSMGLSLIKSVQLDNNESEQNAKDLINAWFAARSTISISGNDTILEKSIETALTNYDVVISPADYVIYALKGSMDGTTPKEISLFVSCLDILLESKRLRHDKTSYVKDILPIVKMIQDGQRGNFITNLNDSIVKIAKLPKTLPGKTTNDQSLVAHELSKQFKNNNASLTTLLNTISNLTMTEGDLAKLTVMLDFNAANQNFVTNKPVIVSQSDNLNYTGTDEFRDIHKFVMSKTSEEKLKLSEKLKIENDDILWSHVVRDYGGVEFRIGPSTLSRALSEGKLLWMKNTVNMYGVIWEPDIVTQFEPFIEKKTENTSLSKNPAAMEYTPFNYVDTSMNARVMETLHANKGNIALGLTGAALAISAYRNTDAFMAGASSLGSAAMSGGTSLARYGAETTGKATLSAAGKLANVAASSTAETYNLFTSNVSNVATLDDVKTILKTGTLATAGLGATYKAATYKSNKVEPQPSASQPVVPPPKPAPKPTISLLDLFTTRRVKVSGPKRSNLKPIPKQSNFIPRPKSTNTQVSYMGASVS